jgi:hypothetical protein
MVAPETVEYVYRARGGAARLFKCHAPEVLIEGPAGTGKTRCVLEKINWLCEEFAGVRVLIARATRTSMTESVLVTLETKVFWEGHEAMAGSEASRENRHAYTYPNGSASSSARWIIPIGCSAPSGTRCTSRSARRSARTRGRSSPARCATAGIPKGVSGGPQTARRAAGDRAGRGDRHRRPGVLHPAHRRLQPRSAQPLAEPAARARGSQMVRLRSRHRDNPSMTAGELAGLRALTGHRRARLYEGRWAAGEGSVYPEFTDRHVIAPFDIPADWPWYVGIDPGYDHPCAILWFTVAPNKCLYVADELYRGGLAVAEHARDIHDRNAGRTVHRYYGDPQHVSAAPPRAPRASRSRRRSAGSA